MDEQPVAFAMRARSPNSCVSSFRYGVSPQPEHAPENSKSGSRNCEPLASTVSAAGSRCGSPRKKSNAGRATSRWASAGAMSRALWRGLLRSFAGQTATQSPQPVQSSGATWIVNARPARSPPLAATDWNPAGACASAAGGYALERMAACGQAKAHLSHWMHRPSSQTGRSRPMARFS